MPPGRSFLHALITLYRSNPRAPPLLWNMAPNEDDLYGDLEDAVAKPKSTTTPTTSDAQVAQLRQQILSLKAENDILKTNMGILYRTSKSELERKDRAIADLQNELDSLRS